MIALSPDGLHYMNDATGRPVPPPYQRRWLLGRLLGPRPHRWAALTYASLAAMPLAAALYLHASGLSGARLAFAVALLCALPGYRISLRFPVLTDAPAYTLALVTAWATLRAPWAALPLALALGATRESGPVFAALWAWHPLPLVGLVAAGWFRKACAPSPAEPWLTRPLRFATAHRWGMGLDGSLYLRPWGAALAGLCAPTWQMLATLAVAHAQIFVAVDTLRLTVWAAPVLCAVAAREIPLGWAPFAVAVTLVHREARA